jgi:hypothetical protein
MAKIFYCVDGDADVYNGVTLGDSWVLDRTAFT